MPEVSIIGILPQQKAMSVFGDPTYRLKIGVATSGGGAGDIRITVQGGTNRIFLGNSVNNTLTTIDGLNNRMGIKNVILPSSCFRCKWGFGSLREGTAISVLAGANAVALTGEYSHYRLTGAAGAFSISTITNGNDGQVLTLVNATNQNMSVLNNNVVNGILTGKRNQFGSNEYRKQYCALLFNL